MTAVEYAPRGLLGVLTPQANTTVEPEFAALLPPGVGMLNARMTSGKATIVARLLDYLASLDDWAAQFANAPVGAVAFACTGASYFAGVAAEEAAVARISAARGVPFLTAGHAMRDAFHALGARRIGLVSPYPQDLTEAAVAYFTALGFEVARVAGSEQRDGVFHPIYAMTAEGKGRTRRCCRSTPRGWMRLRCWARACRRSGRSCGRPSWAACRCCPACWRWPGAA